MNRWIGWLVVASAAFAAGCDTGRAKDELLASAKDYLAKGDPSAGAIQLKNYLAEDPENPDARLLLGQALLDSGEATGAEIELRRARELGVPDDDVLPALARALLATQKPKALTDQFAAVELRDAQKQAEFKTLVASAYRMQNRLGEAENAVAEALQRAPEHEPARLMQANLSASRGRRERAMADVNAILLKSPGNIQALILRGHLLEAANDREGAIRDYRAALGLKDSTLSAHAALISLYLQAQDLDAAQAQWRALKVALPNNPQTQFFEAQIALARGDAARARDIAQNLLRGRSGDASLNLLAGTAELRLGSTARAEALLGKAVQSAPHATAPRLMLARAYLRSGQGARVADVLAPLIEGDAPSAEALGLAARAEVLGGDLRRAGAYFEKAARLKPSDGALRTASAVSRLFSGSEDAGLAELQTIAAEDRGTDADLALATARLQRGDVAGALRALDSMARKEPQSPMPPYLRGRIALTARDVNAARRNFEDALAKDPDFYPAIASLAGIDVGERKFGDAQARFDRLLAKDPKDVRARLALIELAKRRGADRATIARLLVEAVAANPESRGPRLLLVEHHMEGQDFRAALEAAQAGVTALPDDVDLTDRLGRAQLANGNAQQAVRTFETLTRLAPRSPTPWLRLADAQIAAKNVTAARAAVDRAVTLAPKAPAARRAAVAMAVQARQFDDARRHAKAVEMDHPDRSWGLLLLGEIELARGEWDAAAAAFQRAIAKSRDGEATRGLYTALARGGKDREAAQLAASWAADHPKDPSLWLLAGDLALAKQDWVAAERHFRSVVAIQPDHVRALNNIAWLLVKQGKPGAVAFAERAVGSSPSNPVILDTLATAYVHEKLTAKALEVQRKVVSMAPESVSFRINLAKILIAAGDKEGARTELRKLADRQPAFAGREDVVALLSSLGG